MTSHPSLHLTRSALALCGLASLAACVNKSPAKPSSAPAATAALQLLPGGGALPNSIGPNAYGIKGAGIISHSERGNQSLKIDQQLGKVCVKGTLDQVPVPADGSHPPYHFYWGVQFGFTLNDGQAWMPGEVVGFSFVLAGPKVSKIRFKALPFGLDPKIEASEKCKVLTPPSGVVQQVLFSEMTAYCWSPGNPVMDASKGLTNFTVQIPASTTEPTPFDFCLQDVKPILATKAK